MIVRAQTKGWQVGGEPAILRVAFVEYLISSQKTDKQGSLLQTKYPLKVMGTIGSELKAPSQNTPHSSIIISQGVSTGS